MKLKKTIAALATAVLVTGVGAMSAAAATAPANGLERAATTAAEADPVDPNNVGILAIDAPRTIRVGAAVTPFAMTVQTALPMDSLFLAVVDPDDNLVGEGETLDPVAGRPNVFKPTGYVYAEALVSWGPHAILYEGGRATTDDLYSAGYVLTEVRAHSLLGLRASTSGSTTTVQGSARAYNTLQDRYAAWSGRPVSVQRWTGSAWVQVAGVSTDSRGNFTTSVRVPAGSQLRAVVKDVPAIWGAVSATATA